MSKKPRSFTVDEELHELLKQREDLNASAAVNTFLREYLSSGRGTEAALEVRLQQLNNEIAELRQELDGRKQERDRVRNKLNERESDLNKELAKAIEKWNAGELPESALEPDNPAIVTWASNAGVSADRFLTELRTRL